MSHYTIEITGQDTSSDADWSFFRDAIRRVLQEENVASATISLAFVNDAEIHRINREYLEHDHPTDVISFLLNDPSETPADADLVPPDVTINGELIVSTETAGREAGSHGWSPRAELLLYVVHGLLHLCGYDDLTDAARPEMRSRERELLALWGYCPTGLEP